ncbi:hypothetical protein Csa_001067, partial [Cucumis sativus]
MGVIKHSNLLVTTFLMSLLPFTIESQSHVGIIFPLRKYGNIVSGADVTKALKDAWNDACASVRPSAVVIPN